MAIIAKSDDGREFLIMSDGFFASFKDSVWVDKVLFNGYELGHHFTEVKDVAEAKAIIDDAKQALAVSRSV